MKSFENWYYALIMADSVRQNGGLGKYIMTFTKSNHPYNDVGQTLNYKLHNNMSADVTTKLCCALESQTLKTDR